MRLVAIILAALTLSGCTTMQIAENNFIIPDSKRGAAPDPRVDVQALLPAARVSEEAIDTPDGATLRGVVAHRPGSTVTVLYFGGNAFHLDRHGAELLPLLASCGTGIAVFDYRGARHPGRVIVHGQSLGSFMAAYVVQQRPQACGLVLEATSTTVQDWAEVNLPWYARPFLRIEVAESLRGVDNVATVSGYHGASLVLAGERDRTTPPPLAHRVYAALPDRSKQWFVAQGAGHNGIFGHQDVMPVYCSFVNR